MSTNQPPRSTQPQHSKMTPTATISAHGASNDMGADKSLNFPQKLHKMLNLPEFNDIICWLPHGRAWRVQQQDRLESEVLPKFFKHQKYTSFARQVYGWGFNRIPSGPDYNAFYHEFFLRDDPELSLKMKRPSKTELAEQRKMIADSPPNFYTMPPVSASDAGDTAEKRSGAAAISSPSTAKDEYLHELTSLLSTLSSLQEKGVYLRMELDRLDKYKANVNQQLQLLRLTGGTGENQRIPKSSVNISGQLPFQLSTIPQPFQLSTIPQPRQQLPDSRNLNNESIGPLNPWVQRAAQELLLEQQLQLRNTRNTTGFGIGGDNHKAGNRRY